MIGSINTNMIVLARESRCMNQNELAEKVHMSPTNLSKIERGEIGISEDLLEAISEITSYPKHFFCQTGGIIPENLSYRKRQAVSQKLLKPINAQVNVIRRHVQFLTRGLNIDPPTIPLMEVSEKQSPQQIAVKLRKFFDIPPGPISNLAKLLEDFGIAIMPLEFGTQRVDSKSILTDDRYPVVFLNAGLLGDRQRFSLAYELGQLIMHTPFDVSLERHITHEANAFAAEFLMPSKDIKNDFKNSMSVALLGELKKKWKVSMIALLYRADDLGVLTPNQKTLFAAAIQWIKNSKAGAC